VTARPGWVHPGRFYDCGQGHTYLATDAGWCGPWLPGDADDAAALQLHPHDWMVSTACWPEIEVRHAHPTEDVRAVAR